MDSAMRFSSDTEYLRRLEAAMALLPNRPVILTPGLTDAEVARAEERCGLIFPPDLRFFLQRALPFGFRCPDWRSLDEDVFNRLEWPLEGMCFDIRNNAFWWPAWGTRPESDDAAIEIASDFMNSLPKMIPILGHTYIPSAPSEHGNPVFSVHQTDVINRGGNLVEYLCWFCRDYEDEELSEKLYPVFSETYKRIEFWTDLTRYNAGL